MTIGIKMKHKIKVRRTWKINPRTKVNPSGKIYSRKRVKKQLKKLEQEILSDLQKKGS